MRTVLKLVPVLLVCAAVPAEPGESDLGSLYEGHQWFRLRNAHELATGPPLYRGAVAAAFNDPGRAEKFLRSVIKSSPRSDEAYQAYELLTYIAIRQGRYRRLIPDLGAKLTAFAQREGTQREKTTLAMLRGLPDQAIKSFRRSSLRHDGSIFVPVSINGKPARYFFDTGAGVSVLTEEEARRLGLTIREASGTLGTATGNRIGLRTAVAREFTAGNIHLRNVSFAVLPDDQEPWNLLPQEQRGILGLPILVAFRNLRWAKDGTLELGLPPRRSEDREPNLAFDGDKVVVAASVNEETLMFTLDTGAETTDLYNEFANQFPELVSKAGEKGTQQVRGVGRAETFDSVTLPKLAVRIAGVDSVLSPAHVLLKQIRPGPWSGNIGLDLLQQSQAFRIDFEAMRLDLEPDP